MEYDINHLAQQETALLAGLKEFTPPNVSQILNVHMCLSFHFRGRGEMFLFTRINAF